MFKKILISAGLVSLLAAPALAAGDDSCAAMLEKADAVIKTVKLDDAGKKAVADIRAKAEDQLKAGDEDGCKKTAGELLKALGGE